jgi:WD40 repeat protein
MIYGAKPNLRSDRECDILYSHCGPINEMAISYDNKTLFTGGKDGTIFVYKITEGPNNRIGKYSTEL